ncbi:MAG: hypothetical protein ACYCXT_08075 [Acidiferrobacteraceae bacterium]
MTVAVATITPSDAGRSGWINGARTARVGYRYKDAADQDDVTETDFDFLTESDRDEILRAQEIADEIIREFRLLEAVRLCPTRQLAVLSAVIGADNLDDVAARFGRSRKSVQHALDTIVDGARGRTQQLQLFTVDLPTCVPKRRSRAGRPRKNSEGNL